MLYRLNSVGPHALHSPFVFDLYYKVLKQARKSYLPEVEQIRTKLQRDPQQIESTDFKTGNTNNTSIAGLSRSSLSTKKFSSFLSLLCNYLDVESAIETGTSLGINALYMSRSVGQLTTIEGSATIAAIARKNFDSCSSKNIKLINGDLYRVLESEIVRNAPELYFLDADHRSSAIAFCIDLILKHTPNAKCIIIHDIYWSPDMMNMWNELKKDPRFTLSLDLFQAGILFPNLEMEKQHFTLRF